MRLPPCRNKGSACGGGEPDRPSLAAARLSSCDSFPVFLEEWLRVTSGPIDRVLARLASPMKYSIFLACGPVAQTDRAVVS
jgi:hypothetical protein